MAVVSSRASAWRVREPERYAQRLTAVVSTVAMMAMARSRFMARSFPGCSVSLPRDSLFPDPIGRSNRKNPAQVPVLYAIGIGGAGSWVKWLMRGAIGKE